MVDTVSPEKRSFIMRQNRSKNSLPELRVRSALHALGFRFRLHRKDLPGSPDIVLPRHRLAVFVNGCFWHAHEGCKIAKIPKSNTDFWRSKLEKNTTRDALVKKKLLELGWKVLTIWECEICRNLEENKKMLKNKLEEISLK